jgi:hypothetical protein
MRNAFQALLAPLRNSLLSHFMGFFPVLRSTLIRASRPSASKSHIMGFFRAQQRQLALAAFIFFALALPNPARAACASPSKPAGTIIYNSAYHVHQYCDNTNWKAMGPASTGGTLNFIASSNTNSPQPNAVWSDGTYIYVGDFSGGIDVYSFNGTSFSFLATDTTHSTNARSVWSDGTYIYVADGTGGLDAYTFNGTSLTYLATDTTNSTFATKVWGDGTYIYVLNGVNLKVYTFNGTSFTYISSALPNSPSANGVWGDGTYIYVSDSTDGIDAYTFNGTSFTFLATDTTHSTSARDVWGDGTYIYVADYTGGIDVYTFNGSSFTFLDTDTTHSTSALSVWGDGSFLYVGNNLVGVDVYAVDPGTGALTFKDKNTTFTNARSLWGDGTYIYSNSSAYITAYGSFNSCISPTKPAGTILYNPDWRVMQYCDGSSWQSMGPAIRTFSPAVTFDGTNDYLTRGADLTGNADSTQVTGSLWFRRNGGNGSQQVLYCTIDSAGSCRFQVDLNTSNQIHLKGNGTGGGTLRLDAAGSTAITDTNWHHLLFSVDLANTSNRYIYLDGVAETPTWSTYSNAVIDFTRTEHSIGAFTNGASKFNGDVDDMWIDMGTYLDVSKDSVRAKFRDTAGNPVDLGATGTNPTGSQPEVYLSSRGNGLSSWATNKGSGGGFTVTGALTASTANLPGLSCSHDVTFAYITSSSSNFPKEVWTDGNYIYTVNGTGIHAYGFNGASLTLLASHTANSTATQDVWGDGTYIYVADWTGGIDAYTFNGTSFTYLATNTTNSTSASGVWGDGTYIYVADWNGGIDAYTFNGTSFTYLATNTTNSTKANKVVGDGTYIYVADGNAGGGVDVYTFNGTSFTFKATNTTNSTDARGVWSDGTYFYIADAAGGIDAYLYDGSSLTFKATNTTNSTFAVGVWGDGTYIYVADNSSLDAYTFNGTAFTLQATKTGLTNSSGLWGDGMYLFVADNSNSLKAYYQNIAPNTCSCSSPTAVEGTKLYNSDYGVWQYCNGQNWMRMGR